MTKRVLVVLALATLLPVGCAQMQHPVNALGVPQYRYLIGGGFDIDYTAPVDGTAIVVNRHPDTRVLMTRSVKAGESVSFSFDPSSAGVRSVFGDSAKDAVILLYFIPAPSKTAETKHAAM